MTQDHREPSFIGLDIGTSGCRAVAIDATGREIARSQAPLPEPQRPQPGWAEQDPWLWWEALKDVLQALAPQLAADPPAAICVDATSATFLLASPDGEPLGPALMYNDRRSVEASEQIAHTAPSDSAALGPGSSLAKLIHLQRTTDCPGPAIALHQADWILGRLTGSYAFSDWNNALKLGYDAERLGWPSWIKRLVPNGIRLPRVLPPGTSLGAISTPVALELGLPPETLVIVGTTDSTAAVIAAGARQPGDAVTSLGSTLVVKILAERPITAARYGVYSHRFGDHWLAGGASNSGGVVLRQFFADAEIEALSRLIDPDRPPELGYYPLPAPGERFPRQDPALMPIMHPRPPNPSHFLHALLEGIAAIEAEGYARLAELGAPRPRRVLSVGGGATNPTWIRIRSRILGLDVTPAAHQEAAYGSARLAQAGVRSPALVSEPHRL